MDIPTVINFGVIYLLIFGIIATIFFYILYNHVIAKFSKNYDISDEGEAKIPVSLFKHDDGGFGGMNDDGTLNNEIYYIGIIDILQQYDLLKFTENKYKSYCSKDYSTEISALPPQKYAKRFIEFIISSIK